MLTAIRQSVRPLERLVPACTAALPQLAAPAAAAAGAAATSQHLRLHSSDGSAGAASSTLGLKPAVSSSTAGEQLLRSPLREHDQSQHWQTEQGQEQGQEQEPWQHIAAADSMHAAGEDEQAHYMGGRLHDDAQFKEQQQQLLAAALRHVPALGWGGGAAAAAAAAELGLSPAAAGMLGSDAELVQLFFADCNRQLEAELAGRHAELAGMDVRERLRLGLQLRLAMLQPFIASWPQALSLLARPAGAARTLRLYAEMADAIWHAAGDASTDLSWYTKRGLLTGVFTTTELYMLTDCSPGFADTWAALDRRLAGAFHLAEAAEEAGSLAIVGGGMVGALAAQLNSLLRRSPA